VNSVASEVSAALRSTEFLGDPYPTYELLRREDPVHWSDDWGCWIVTRYEDVSAVLRETKVFSSAGRFSRMIEGLPEELRHEILEAWPLSGLFQSDPPEYTRHRQLLGKAFTQHLPPMRAKVEQMVSAIAEVATARGQIDIIDDLAAPLPADVVMEMVGIPSDDRAKFKNWCGSIIALLSSGVPDIGRVDQFRAATSEAKAWIANLIEDRRATPTDDMLSALVASESSIELMTDTELLVTVIQFLLAGHETTTNLIGNGTLSLLRHEDQLRDLCENADDAEVVATAVEELLRFESPLQRLSRRATEDVELHGKQIRNGDIVMVMLGAANHDPETFAMPDKLDIRRSPNRHAAFGFGTHFCLGAPLARIEGAIVFRQLLRFPGLRLVDETPAWQENVTFHGVRSLRVAIEPQSLTR
jgi:pimeloyl-[acyl-carrier protein] synthase